MKCCPPGRGHNLMGGYQACHMACARRSSDREAVECMEIAWRRFERLPWWRLRARREALAAFRVWRDRANRAPMLFAPPPRTPGLGRPETQGGTRRSSPFREPGVMSGYPLDPDEQAAVDRVVAESKVFIHREGPA